MLGVSVAPRRIFGVHLAATDGPEHRIWVCRAHPGSDGVRIESIERLVDLPAGTAEPAAAAAVLVSKIRDAPRSAWGFDAPFGVPADGSERRTDRERGVARGDDAEARWMRQGLLEPLASNASVCRLPLDPPPMVVDGMPPEMIARAPSTYLLEVSMPALLASLADEGVALRHDDEASARTALRTLAAAGLVRPARRPIRDRIVSAEGAGGLAALYCAVAAWRGYRNYDHAALHADPEFSSEGFVYC